jgi:hypothetical protein
MPLSLSGSGGITYPDGSVNTTRSVSAAGDTINGRLVVNTSGVGFDTFDANGYARISRSSGSAQLGLFRTSDSVGGFYLGGDSSDFRVYNSSFAPVILADQTGRVRMPYQPTFEMWGSGAFAPANTYVTITYSQTYVNIGSHMNASTGIFTAPVVGTYQFHGRFEYDGSTADIGVLHLNINGADTHQFLEYNNRYGGPSFSINVTLSANDTVRLRTYGSNGLTGTSYSHRFGGRLLG